MIGLTADHSINAKIDRAGQPNVIYLQNVLDARIGVERARVILPITDSYVYEVGLAEIADEMPINPDVDLVTFTGGVPIDKYIATRPSKNSRYCSFKGTIRSS